jgi:maltose alpha-D-glucosyltransferase/alpha-amylase
MSRYWYKNAVIYALDVETFYDSDGDGVGDFRGLTQRLDYLSGLGVTCLWLLPFYPTPNRDDGYDVADYYAIDPRLGTLGDFVVFMRAARERGIRVLVDLVVNHTSVDHPWFQAARRDPASKYRDYYLWTDSPPPRERRGGVVFPGEQAGNWAYDAVAGAYYWHWFYDHQPDLNTGNPAVREEIKKILGFWLQLGISGFRVDAAPFLFKRKGLRGTWPDDPGGFMQELREFLDEERADAVFLAEADVATDELSFFLGEGERMHLLLNFILDNYLFLALADERARPIAEALRALPELPAVAQWANFLRNHDELNLDRLPAVARERVFARFAPDPAQRIYGRGIRRRLAPMLEGGERWQEMVYSLLFSLPGTPVLRYGDEIGMGDDLSLPGRLGVRTPMQWSGAPNGGFSAAPAERLVRPVVRGGPFGYERVNVDAQRRDPLSLLNFVLRLIRTRKETPEFGHGALTLLETGDPHVLAHACEGHGGLAMAIHNLSAEPCTARLVLDPADVPLLVDLLGDRAYEPILSATPEFRLEGHGYRWLRVQSLRREIEVPLRAGPARDQAPPAVDAPAPAEGEPRLG